MIVLYVLAGIIGAILGFVFLCFLLLFVLSVFARNKDYDKQSGFYLAVFLFYLRVALFCCRIKIKVTGREKIDGINGKFLLISNHRSNFDPFVTAVALKKQKMAFISKAENFKVPLFGKVARKCMYTAIDRENPRNAIKTINRTAEIINSGRVSYAVYPEGTRSKSVNMLSFHDGVFKIAQKAQAPIVVVGVRGTEKIHSRAPWKRTVVYLDVLGVIDREKVTELSSHELSNIAREELMNATEGK